MELTLATSDGVNPGGARRSSSNVGSTGVGCGRKPLRSHKVSIRYYICYILQVHGMLTSYQSQQS